MADLRLVDLVFLWSIYCRANQARHDTELAVWSVANSYNSSANR